MKTTSLTLASRLSTSLFFYIREKPNSYHKLVLLMLFVVVAVSVKSANRLNAADQMETLAHGESRWKNRVQWARQTMVEKGHLDKSVHGVWTITQEGLKRLESDGPQPPDTAEVNLEAVWDAYESAFRQKTLDRLSDLEDEEVRRALIQLKGIGPWTADIYLLMALLRPDIWPSGDLALVSALQQIKHLPEKPTADQINQFVENWKPWRSVAARIAWHFYLN